MKSGIPLAGSAPVVQDVAMSARAPLFLAFRYLRPLGAHLFLSANEQDVSEALALYEGARRPRADAVMALSAENGRRLVPASDAEYSPGSHASAATLGLMEYDPLAAPLGAAVTA